MKQITRRLKIVADLSEYKAALLHAHKLVVQLEDTIKRLSDCGITVTCKYKIDPFVNKVNKLVRIKILKRK